jgi:hypothetical protein
MLNNHYDAGTCCENRASWGLPSEILFTYETVKIDCILFVP